MPTCRIFTAATEPVQQPATPISTSSSKRSARYVYTIGMPLRLLRVLAATGPLALAAASADTIKLTNSTVFRAVRTVDFRENRLVFRGVSGQYLRKPLEQVAWFELDGRPALSAAEQQAAAGNWPAATDGYEAALAEPGPDWLRDLIRVRFLVAAEQAGRLARAVELYADLLASQPLSAARYAPRAVGPPGSHTNAAARAVLLARLAAPAPIAGRGALRTLLLELLLIDEAPLPPGFAPPDAVDGPQSRPARPKSASETEASSRPARRRGIIVDPDEPEESPEPGKPAPEPPPVLGADSRVLAAAERAVAAGECERALRLIELGRLYVAPGNEGPWRLARGKTLIAAGRPAEAAADLLALAESDAGLAAVALYYSGVAGERSGQPDFARALYRRVLDRPDVGEEIRALAADGLKRLSGEDPGDR